MRGITCHVCYKLLLVSDYPAIAQRTIDFHIQSHIYDPDIEDVEMFDE